METESQKYEFSPEERKIANEVLDYMRKLDHHPYGVECPGTKGYRFPISPGSYVMDAKALGEKCIYLYSSIKERIECDELLNVAGLNSTLNDEVELVGYDKTESENKIQKLMEDATDHLKRDLDILIAFIKENLKDKS